MKFRELSLYFKKVEDTSSRLEITRLLSDLFKKLKPDEIDKTVYLLQGRVLPLYEPLEFGFAEKMVIKSIEMALHLEKGIIWREYKKIGDIGKTVEHFKKQYSSLEDVGRPAKKDLHIHEVYNELYKLATKTGLGSQDVKINILAVMIRQLDPLSCRYLVRIPLGIMRLGFSDMTILDAYSWMLNKDKTLRSEIERAYHVRPDLGQIGRLLKEKSLKGIRNIRPKLFTPIIMMRAERLSSGDEIIKKIGPCIVEPKYDGFRLQVHYGKGKVRLYSRNLEEVSFMYPDLIGGIKKQINAKEVIFEGEAIGFDPHSGSFLPFQETVQRKRKYGIAQKAKEIPLKLFVFELLYLNGKSYINEPFSKRREKLSKIIKLSRDEFKGLVLIASEKIVSDSKKLEMLFEEAISKGLEGVVAKKLTGIYQPGARGWNWIKFKRSYSAKIEDTIDCLVMGYDYGKGKRAGFGIGAFLVGVYAEKEDAFKTIAKIGTGLSDEEWRELKKRCNKFEIAKKPALYKVDKQTYTDVWIKPTIVVEIKADEITRSPVHTAGLALRFPRLEKFRDDKRPEDVTTLKELDKMFKVQGSKKT